MAPDTDLEDALEGGSDQKAELDTEELTSNLPKENQKVELDLEDAPFLEEEDDDEDEEEIEEEDSSLDLEGGDEEDEEPWYRRKKIVIPAAAALLLLLGGLAYMLFSGSEPDTAPMAETPPEVETLEEQEGMPPPPPEEPEVQEFMVTLAPFWVEQREPEGKVRFLVCQFTAVTENEKLSFEISQKTTVLRDAVYYYLSNKDLTFLSDKNNAESLKADLLSVMNQYLSQDRLETILIDQYLVK